MLSRLFLFFSPTAIAVDTQQLPSESTLTADSSPSCSSSSCSTDASSSSFVTSSMSLSKAEQPVMHVWSLLLFLSGEHRSKRRVSERGSGDITRSNEVAGAAPVVRVAEATCRVLGGVPEGAMFSFRLANSFRASLETPLLFRLVPTEDEVVVVVDDGGGDRSC